MMETKENLTDKIDDLLFGVRRSIRYHNRRRSFYDKFNSTTNALALIMGSATVYGVLQDNPSWIAIFAPAIVTIFSSINLVIGSNRQARVHHDLSKRFIELEKKMSDHLQHTEEKLAEWTSERLDIESEEPPVLRVLDCICHNELVRAMGYGPEHLAEISWYQRLFADFVDLNEHTIKVG